VSVCDRDCCHLFFLLAGQDLTDCRVLPFLADDLLPVEEASLQVQVDFSSPAECSECCQASRQAQSNVKQECLLDAFGSRSQIIDSLTI